MVLGIGGGEALKADLFSGALRAQHGRVVGNASSADENGECGNDAKTRRRRDLRLIGLFSGSRNVRYLATAAVT